jgi:hypothetical protein
VAIDTDILLSLDPFDAEKWENGPMVKRQPDIKEKKWNAHAVQQRQTQ